MPKPKEPPSDLTVERNLYVQGNAGIGTSEPTSKLTVGAVPASLAAYGVPSGQYLPTQSIKANPETDIALTLLNNGINAGDSVYIDFLNEFSPRQFNWIARIEAMLEQDWTIDAATRNSALAFQTALRGVPGERMRINSDGMHVKGNIKHDGSLVQGSSREMKENIVDLPSQEASETLDGLNPVKFNLKADERKDLQLGFVAEDAPDLVSSSGGKAISTNHIVAILTKVVQEQRKAISALTEKVKALETAGVA